MNKAQLVARVSGKANCTQAAAKEIIEALVDTVKEVVVDESITLVGFGTFSVKQMNARTGRNPSTGEAIQIAASKKIVFKPGKEFKDSMNR